MNTIHVRYALLALLVGVPMMAAEKEKGEEKGSPRRAASPLLPAVEDREESGLERVIRLTSNPLPSSSLIAQPEAASPAAAGASAELVAAAAAAVVVAAPGSPKRAEPAVAPRVRLAPFDPSSCSTVAEQRRARKERAEKEAALLKAAAAAAAAKSSAAPSTSPAGSSSSSLGL